MRKLFLLLLCLCIVAQPVAALDASRPNNKFGIHVAQPDDTDIADAAKLVNSAGGKWGYITLVIQETDRNIGKWQEVMNKLRERRLIPIIRIATVPQGASWRKPEQKDVTDWVNFLNSLNWVVKDRYVVLFNEPNHGAEWGGATNPEDYADIAYVFAKSLKEKNKDYFIMLAGFDASAPPQPPRYEDEGVFLSRMKVHKPELFTSDMIDGLSSHSYPNPGFSGSPYGSGKGSIRTYEWELELFRNLGVARELPVFITETGWVHNGAGYGTSQSPDDVAAYLRTAFESIWLPDSRVRAVTPFILNYQGEPFLQFSWKKLLSEDFYPQYKTVQDIPKVSASPKQHQAGTIKSDLPGELVASSTYVFPIRVKNTGQAIWDESDGYRLQLTGGAFNYFFSPLTSVAPGEEYEVDLHVKTQNVAERSNFLLNLYRDEERVLAGGKWSFEVVPLPTLMFTVDLFPRIRRDSERTYEIQIFDAKERLVYKKKGIRVKGGRGSLAQVPNVYTGSKFRIVVLTDYYLPRQRIVTFTRGENKVAFEALLPLDFDLDGNLDWNDLWTLISKPVLFRLFLP